MNKSIILFVAVVIALAGASFFIFKSPALAPIINSTNPKEETVAVIGQRILNGGIYITPLQVISDSRCPVDAQCIWAGEILIKVKLEKGEIIKEVELKKGDSVVFEKNNVTFVSVTPENKTTLSISQKDYKFTFKVVSATTQGTVQGTVTLSPICPVERIPPDPNCAPKFYSTSIDIMKAGSAKILKTIQSDSNGAFSVDLDSGAYILQAGGGAVLPRCSEVSVEVKSGQYTKTEISCDTGIR